MNTETTHTTRSVPATKRINLLHKITVLREEVAKINEKLGQTFSAASRGYLLGMRDAYQTTIRFLSI